MVVVLGEEWSCGRMPSLNVDIDFFDHPKTKRLVRLLGRGSEVLPLKLWVYAARYFTDDGRLTGLSAQEIEDEVRWWGESGKMVKVMLMPDVQFIELIDDVYCVHDWQEHEGHLSAFKERAKLGAKARWDKAKGSNGHPLSDASSDASSNAPTGIALPTKLIKEIAAAPPAIEPKPSKPRKKTNRRTPCPNRLLVFLLGSEISETQCIPGCGRKERQAHSNTFEHPRN